MKSQINIIIDMEYKPQESKSRESKPRDSKHLEISSSVSKISGYPEKEQGYKQYADDRYNGWWM